MLAPLTPTGLVEMRHALRFDVVTRLLHRLGDHRRRGLLGLADCAHTHRYPEQLVQHLLGRALGQAIGPGTQRYRGVDTGAIGATGNACGPGKARRLATLQARQLMPLVLGDHWLDGRHLDYLMTKRRGILSL